MTQVTLQQLTKQYVPNHPPAVESLSLEIKTGEIVALLGPSGSGKTTALKMVAGLIQPTSGDVLFNKRSVLGIPAEKRGAVMVFQNHLLFPYMSIGENIGFGLKMRGVDRAIIRQRTAEMLDLVRLPQYFTKRRPKQLSGGQQQRVALARALITEPNVLLLDEPLSNLDTHLRDEMRGLIQEVQSRFNITTLIVTHNQRDVVYLADRVALLFDGRLQQYAAPTDFYRRPASIEVARFFGGVNFLAGETSDNCVQTALGCLEISTTPDAEQITLTIRPERVLIGTQNSGVNSLQGEIAWLIDAGTLKRAGVQIGEVTLEAASSAPEADGWQVGAAVWVHLPPEHLWPLRA